MWPRVICKEIPQKSGCRVQEGAELLCPQLARAEPLVAQVLWDGTASLQMTLTSWSGKGALIPAQGSHLS